MARYSLRDLQVSLFIHETFPPSKLRPLPMSVSILLSDYGKGPFIFSPLKFLHSLQKKGFLCGIPYKALVHISL